MKENFFKKVIKGALVTSLTMLPKEANSPTLINLPEDKKNQIENKDVYTPTPEIVVNNHKTQETEISTDLEKSLRKLHEQRVSVLEEVIKEDKAEILLNTDISLFNKDFDEKMLVGKDWFEAGCNSLDELYSKIDSLSIKDVSFMLEFQKQHLINEDSAASKEDRGEFKSLNDEINFELPEYKILRDSVKNNDRLFMQDLMIGFDLYRLISNHRELFSSIDSSSKNEQDKRKVFKAFFDEIKRAGREEILYFKDEEAKNKARNDAWVNRDSKEYLEGKLLSHEKELENINKFLNEKDLRGFIESSRSWLLNNVMSADYLNRLIKEGYTQEEALKIQSERFERLKNIPYSIDPNYNDYSKTNLKKGKASITYNANDLAIRPEANSVHELEHGLTLLNLGISKKAKDLYKKAFITHEEFKKVVESDLGRLAFPSNDIGYYSFSTEIDARKKILEYQMEKLGIKEYGETMTLEHYVKLIELMKEGKLDQASIQILLMLTKEGLIDILNTIAKNDKEVNENKV